MSKARSTDCLRELAVKTGDDLADGLGSTGRGRNDVPIDGASTTPILVGGTVDSLLRGGRGVNRAHQALDDAEIVVNDLCEGRQAVGRARRIGDLTNDEVRLEYMRLTNTYHSVFGIVRVKIDTTNKHGCICRGRRDDNFLGTTLQVSRCPERSVTSAIFWRTATENTHFSVVVKTPDDSMT